ncbi:ferredoxin [Candidatus Pacearchaeota archaeon]|nr:ferredoxin [Candidatus Pacearchaeota archaeon]
MKLKIDKDKCTGCGLCNTICPEIFAIENQKAKVLKQKTDNNSLKEAIDICPSQAIILT